MIVIDIRIIIIIVVLNIISTRIVVLVTKSPGHPRRPVAVMSQSSTTSPNALRPWRPRKGPSMRLA